VLRYWYRRAVRIAPAHWASLVATYVFMLRGRHAPMPREAAAALAHYGEGACPGGLWTQAAFLGHLHMSAGCGLQLWSQVYMYQAPMLGLQILCPVRRDRSRPAVCEARCC
jgi:peptidoglycan/LPS O-acetylase OafA/YrhL